MSGFTCPKCFLIFEKYSLLLRHRNRNLPPCRDVFQKSLPSPRFIVKVLTPLKSTSIKHNQDKNIDNHDE